MFESVMVGAAAAVIGSVVIGSWLWRRGYRRGQTAAQIEIDDLILQMEDLETTIRMQQRVIDGTLSAQIAQAQQLADAQAEVRRITTAFAKAEASAYDADFDDEADDYNDDDQSEN